MRGVIVVLIVALSTIVTGNDLNKRLKLKVQLKEKDNKLKPMAFVEYDLRNI